jgi:hypothetical protein
MPVLPAPVQRLLTRLHQSAAIRSRTSSTRIGTLTTPMATNGCALRVQLFSFWNGYYPFLDYSTGGSIDGMIRAAEVNLAKVTDKMIVIPGHGVVGDKSQLAFYRDLLVGTRERVAASRNKANRSTKLSPQSLPPPQTQSGETA